MTIFAQKAFLLDAKRDFAILTTYNPPRMRWGFKKECEIEAWGASAMLRVTVKPKFQPLPLALEALGLAVFIVLGWNRWLDLYRRLPSFFILFLIGAVTSLWYRFTGAEEIEFDGQRRVLTIRENILGWPRVREYSLDAVSALEPRYDQNQDGPQGLCCKVGKRTITFGKGVNAEQANRILAELQRAFPEASHAFLAGNDPFDKHFTTLKLS